MIRLDKQIGIVRGVLPRRFTVRHGAIAGVKFVLIRFPVNSRERDLQRSDEA